MIKVEVRNDSGDVIPVTTDGSPFQASMLTDLFLKSKTFPVNLGKAGGNQTNLIQRYTLQEHVALQLLYGLNDNDIDYNMFGQLSRRPTTQDFMFWLTVAKCIKLKVSLG